jgi:hypothetical protein
MAKSRRGATTPSKGRRSRAEEALSRKAVQHHDFVGDAAKDRERSRAVEEQRMERDRVEMEQDVVREMEQEFEQVAGIGQQDSKPFADVLNFPRPRSFRQGFEILRDRGPAAFEILRSKAEQRLATMPAPVKGAVRVSERAFGFLAAPVRVGVHLVADALRTPAQMLRLLLVNRRTA